MNLVLFFANTCCSYVGRQEEIHLPFERQEKSDFTSFLPQQPQRHFNSLFSSLRDWVPASSRYVKVRQRNRQGFYVRSNRDSYRVLGKVRVYNSCINLPQPPVCPRPASRLSCSPHSPSLCRLPGRPRYLDMKHLRPTSSPSCPLDTFCCYNGCANVCVPTTYSTDR